MSSRRYRGVFLSGLVLAILELSACGSSGPPPKLYVLGDTAQVGTGDVSQLSYPVLELKPVRIPDYLDTTDIFVRQAGGHIVASQSARWGERLSVGVTRAIAISLDTRLPHVAVTTSPSLEEPRWQILIDIDSFETQADGQCVLAGRWSVWQGRGRQKLNEERISLATQVGKESDAEVVAAMTRQVDDLAGRIALALETRMPRASNAETE
jgi:uncharacterized lipoprotein YmbA